jgi:hypothetical protein
MVLKLEISAETEAALKSKAHAAGVEVEQYASNLIERLAHVPLSLKALRGKSHAKSVESGMSEDELSDFLELEKHEMRAEKREKRSA